MNFHHSEFSITKIIFCYIKNLINFNFIYRFTGTKTECINLGSYNYLGFAESSGPCAEESISALKKYGIASCSSRLELGMKI